METILSFMLFLVIAAAFFSSIETITMNTILGFVLLLFSTTIISTGMFKFIKNGGFFNCVFKIFIGSLLGSFGLFLLN